MKSMNVQPIPEMALREAAKTWERSQEEGTNAFTYALEVGLVYKQANLSPLYLLDSDAMSIYITSKQRIQNKFH